MKISVNTFHCNKAVYYFSIYLVMSVVDFLFSDGLCSMPEHYWGDWYSFEGGDNLDTIINDEGWSNKYLDASCADFHIYNETIDSLGRFDSRILLYSR